MQSDSQGPEPRLAALLALVGGILALTGVCVASYLSEDALRVSAPKAACSTTGCAAQETGHEPAPTLPCGSPCGDVTEFAAPAAPALMGRVTAGRVRVG